MPPRLSATHHTSSSRSSVVSLSAPQQSTSKPAKISYEIPHLTRTPWELARNKRKNSTRRNATLPLATLDYVFPATIFRKLPREVYDCIVEQLELSYRTGVEHNPAVYLRDLCSLSLTSRTWHRAAALRLYRKVWALDSEGHSRMPKVKIRGTGRLKLLRRTLRNRPGLADCVREIDASQIWALYQDASIEKEDIVNQIASLVMACPKLERLIGFHIPFTHTFDRLSHALSTRQNLKERLWLLSDSTGLDPDEEDDDDVGIPYYHKNIDPQERFLELNSNHSTLTTLVLHQHQPCLATPLTFRAIIGTLRQFPSLHHLSISGHSASSFTNLALNALPSNLRSLRLENLPGINDKGLHRFASSHSSTSLQSLSLIDLEISSLVTVSAFLSPHLVSLRHFTLAQHRAPLLPNPQSLSTEIPSLSSHSLRTLHWELRSQAGPPLSLHSHFTSQAASTDCFPFTNSEPIASLATSLLATNIKKGNFPALRQMRAPHDPQGLLQMLCKPRASALLPSDTQLLHAPPPKLCSQTLVSDFAAQITEAFDLRGGSPPATDASYVTAITSLDKVLVSRNDSVTSSPKSAEFRIRVTPPPASRPYSPALRTRHHYHHNSINNFNSKGVGGKNGNLPDTFLLPAHSRLLAQSRILGARKQPAMQIRVFDPAGELVEKKTVYAYMGTLGSKIEYVVCPDRCRMEKSEESNGSGVSGGSPWLTGIKDLAGDYDEGYGEYGYGYGYGYDIGREKGTAAKIMRTVDVMELF